MYVWAVEQDNLSKRALPTTSTSPTAAGAIERDLLVPWVLAPGSRAKGEEEDETTRKEEQVFHRYYHFFEHDELRELVLEAVQALQLVVGSPADFTEGPSRRGVEIAQDGWERSNSYIELRLWVS